MSWLAIILFIIKEIPEIISVVQAIIAFFRGRKGEAPIVRADFTQAIQSGDLDNVRAVASHWHKRCEGVACPADLVGE